jgi:PrcB C-terminal
MRITLLCLVLHGAVVAQTAPSLTPTLPLPNNPTLQEPARAIPAQPATPARTEAPTQWPGQYGGSPDFATAIARDQPGWERLWHWVSMDPPQPLNAATEMGVMVHLGQRPTGGYRVRVLKTYTEGERFVIEFTEVAPAPDGYVTQAVTQPWVIALVPHSKLPVVFKK